MTSQAEQLTNALADNDYRITHARQAIIKCLVQSGGHISADGLATLVRADAPHVGRATVFRTLELLSELGMIRPVYQGTGAAHYVLMDRGSHHHLICCRCHQVIEFDDCLEHEITQALGQRFRFQVQSHLLEVFGLCEACWRA
ncbi:MAG: Fur family transcriptional regulator [Chloroflexota bacterium]|nr:Fur family transcriptional regulator [Chloroflexota bacterium]